MIKRVSAKEIINEDLKDEKSASTLYFRLSKRLAKEGHSRASKTVAKIAKDEKKHRRLLTTIKKGL